MKKSSAKTKDKHIVDFEHEIILPDNTVIEAKIQALWELVNNGIGKYECWGAKFTDNQYDWELFDMYYVGEGNEDFVSQYIDQHIDELTEISRDILISKQDDR